MFFLTCLSFEIDKISDMVDEQVRYLFDRNEFIVQSEVA